MSVQGQGAVDNARAKPVTFELEALPIHIFEAFCMNPQVATDGRCRSYSERPADARRLACGMLDSQLCSTWFLMDTRLLGAPACAFGREDAEMDILRTSPKLHAWGESALTTICSYGGRATALDRIGLAMGGIPSTGTRTAMPHVFREQNPRPLGVWLKR